MNTYDAFPALLVAGSLAALLWRRDSVALRTARRCLRDQALRRGTRPLFAIWLWRTGRPLARPLAAVVSVLVLVGPFALVGWDGLVESVRAQAGRGLQIESLGCRRAARGAPAGRLRRRGRPRLDRCAHPVTSTARCPMRSRSATSVAQVGAVAVALLLFLRARSSGERLTLATAATLAGFLAFARFVSPQYLVWLVPIVPLVGGVAGVVATVASAQPFLLAGCGSSTTARSSHWRQTCGSSLFATYCSSRSMPFS